MVLSCQLGLNHNRFKVILYNRLVSILEYVIESKHLLLSFDSEASKVERMKFYVDVFFSFKEYLLLDIATIYSPNNSLLLLWEEMFS